MRERQAADSAHAGVLFITRKWPPAIGGMETYSVELTRHLAERVPLEVIALPGHENGNPPTFRELMTFTTRAIARYAKLPGSPAVLHIGDMAAWPLALLPWMRLHRPVIVLSAHGTDVSFPRRRTIKARIYGVYLKLGSKLLRRARVIANSRATARVASETGWQTTRIIPLATNVDAPAPCERHTGEILFVGRLVERKGCLWFVRNVLPLLPAHLRLNVAGPIWDEKEREALDHPQVNYLGSINGAALNDAYRSALCVVVPNIDPPSGEFEGFGLVASEASAAGGLVLASATGGLIEAVIDGETGFLVEAGNAQEWANKIIEILSWPNEKRKGFLFQAWRRAREVFSWKRVADETYLVYQNEHSPMQSRPSGNP